jgi:hypothetical protein
VKKTILFVFSMMLAASILFSADKPYVYPDYPVKGYVTTEIFAFDNPEAALFSMDGRYLFVSNAGVSDVKGGGAWGFIEGQGSISRLTMGAAGTASLTERYFISGITGPLGMAVLNVSTSKFARGTIFVAAGNGPLTDNHANQISNPARHKPEILAFDPNSGNIIGRISMAAGTVFDKINGSPPALLNSLTFDKDGNLYVADTEVGFDSFKPNLKKVGGTWKIFHDTIDDLSMGKFVEAKPQFIRNAWWPDGIEANPITNDIWVNIVGELKPENPSQGGTWAYRAADFKSGKSPEPIYKNLGRLDGMDFTVNGTNLQTEGGRIVVIPHGGKPTKLVTEPAVVFTDPADIDVMTLADGSYLLVVAQFHNKLNPAPAWDDKITLVRLPADFD